MMPEMVVRSNVQSATRPAGVSAAGGMCGCRPRPIGFRIGTPAELLPAILLVILPKCPMCLGGWLGLMGLAGIVSPLKSAWGAPLWTVMLAAALALIGWQAWRSKN